MRTPRIASPFLACSSTALTLITVPSSAVEIARESFEGAVSPLFSTTGLISSPDQFYVDQGDFWTATSGSMPFIVSGSSSGGAAIYTGQDGSRYWAGQDLNAVDDESDTVVFGPINVSGHINLEFTGLFAADGQFSGTPRYDAGEGLHVEWSIDGSPFVQGVAFKAAQPGGDMTNNDILQDTDLDGIGDGVLLGPMFTSYGFTIPSTGSSLTIRVTGISTGSQEEFAFDNLTISGDPTVINQAPTANSLTATDVGEAEIGDTSYTFDILYADDSAIATATVDIGDVTVTGPSGSLTVTGAVSSPAGNGTPRTVTYTVTPPGGSWDAADNGSYDVDINANELGDDGAPQLFVAAGNLGSFNVAATNTPPFLSSVFALPVINSDAGETSYSFNVTYGDVGGVSAASIGAPDVTVTGPGGIGILTVAGAVAGGPDGTLLTATYTVIPPGGSWDAAADGVYTIAINGGQVSDVVGAFVQANVSAGSFEVDSDCIRRESFESVGPNYDTGLITAADQFFASATDFWAVTNGSNIESASANPAAYSGENGSRYWAGQDLDHQDDNSDTVVFGPIPISGFTDLSFSGLFAADGLFGGNPASPRYDTGEGLEVAWSIDGSPFVTALAFKAEGASNTNIREDTNLDGTGDGSILGPVFSSHSFNIASTGNSISIRVTGILDGSQEEVAFDDLKVSGTPPSVNLAPVFGSLAAADVGETEIGDTSYSFDVIYSDDSAIDVSTIGTGDVTVTGPGGSLTVTGVTVAPAGNGSPRTATYTVTPPGGDWDSGDNGTYTVAIVANEVGDDDGTQLFVAAGNAGMFEVTATNTAPVVSMVSAPNRSYGNLGETSYTFIVTYTDVGEVQASSISASNVTVTGPGGPLTVTSGTTSDPDGSSLTATYTVTPPGGLWTGPDDGTYTIGIVASQVMDDASESVVANPNITTFEVDSATAARESFELTGPSYDSGLITAAEKFLSGPTDFWTDTDGSNIDSASASPALYSGENGFRYWAGQDLDHLDDGADVVEFGPIPISNFTGLSFSGLFAADGLFGGNASTPRYDPGEGIEIAWSIDGSSFVTALAFKSELNTGQNGNLRKDDNLDGVGEGGILGPVFSTHTFPIGTNGDNLTIRVTGILDGSQEEIAFDDLRITGTPNLPPIAGADSANRFPSQSVKISTANLLSNDSDPEGNNPLSVTAVNYTGGNGASVTLSGGLVLYNPGSHTGVDTFEYTVEDSLGASATGTVTVDIVNDNSPSENLVKMETLGDGSVRTTFAGIPGRTYRVQTSTDMVNWIDAQGGAITADAQGQIVFTDPAPVPAMRFYRTVFP